MGQMPEWYDANVSSAVLFGVCRSPSQVYFEYIYTKDNWECLANNGIYASGMPNYEEKKADVAKCAGPGMMENWEYINHFEYLSLQDVALYG